MPQSGRRPNIRFFESMVPLTGAAAANSRLRTGPPCRRCSPVPHLPSSPTSKTGQTGMQDDRGNDEARCEPVRRPACAARGADGIGAIQLSEPAGENPGRLHTRHGSRPCGAHSCRPVFGNLGRAVRGRECSRRRQQHRHRTRRQGGRRRLHVADGRQPGASHQSELV
jgi:hypothetical protein